MKISHGFFMSCTLSSSGHLAKEKSEDMALVSLTCQTLVDGRALEPRMQAPSAHARLSVRFQQWWARA
jgi:hypothetical protein